MKLSKLFVTILAMEYCNASGKVKTDKQSQNNDLVDPLVGGSCPSLPPLDGIERPNPNDERRVGEGREQIADSVSGMCWIAQFIEKISALILNNFNKVTMITLVLNLILPLYLSPQSRK